MSAVPPIRRNEPCPCGSGRRYRDCHGRLTPDAPAASPTVDVERAQRAHQQGRLDEAEAIYRAVLEREPANAVALHYLGLAMWQRGRANEAEPLMRRALEAEPGIPQFWNNLGLLLRETGRPAESQEAFRRARELDPGYGDAISNLADTHLRLGEPEKSVELLASAPPTFEGLYTLALAQERLDRYDDALASMQRCRESLPRNLAAIEAELDSLIQEKAEIDARRIPGGRDASLEERRRVVGRAIAQRRALLQANAAFAKVAFRLSTQAFLAGDLARAWRDFGWRRGRREFEALPGHADGTFESCALPARLDGARVEIRREQGLGDMLFFLRYAPRLRARGARVRLRGDPRLAPLLERTALFDELVDESLPGKGDADFELSAGDLLGALGSPDRADLPPALALVPLPVCVDRARRALRMRAGVRTLAVTWRAGTPSDDPGGIPLKVIDAFRLGRALADFPGEVASVQRNPTAEENDRFREGLGRPFIDLSRSNDDLEEMLGLVAAADCYVGVSNTNMHLRAGLGLAATVLVPRPYEWRWPGTEPGSPWFPNFAALRETRIDGWEPALVALGTQARRGFALA